MVNTVKIVIDADSQLAEKEFKKVQSSFGKLKDSVVKNSRAIGLGMTAIGAGIVGVAALSIKSFNEQQIGINKLNQALINVGTSYDAQRVAIERVIEAQQRKTNFGDEEQRKILTQLTAVLGDNEKALIALPVVLDAIAFSGLSAQSVMGTMSSFLAGVTNTSTAARISLDSTATFTERLGAVMKVTGGAAEAVADPFTQLKNRLGDVSQELGAVLIPFVEKAAVVLEEVARKVIEFSEAHPTLIKVLGIATAAIGGILLVLGPLLVLLPAIIAGVGALGVAMAVATGPIGLVVLAIAGLVLAAKSFGADWDQIWEAVQAVVVGVKNVLVNAFSGIAEGIALITDLLPGLSGLFDDSTKSIKDFGVAAALSREQLAGLNLEQLNAQLIKFKEVQNEIGFAIAEARVDTLGEAFIGLKNIVMGTTGGTQDLRDAYSDITAQLNETKAAIRDFGNQAVTTGGVVAEATSGQIQVQETFVSKMDSLLRRQLNEQINIRKRNLADLIESSQEGQRVLKVDAEARLAIEADITAKFASLTQRQVDEVLAGSKAKMRALTDASTEAQRLIQDENRTREMADQSFQNQTDSILFNLSRQGLAWKDLGSSAQGVIDAISQTMGAAAKGIVDNLKGMKREGESWKDLLLRLDTEGVINLNNLARAFLRLGKEADDASEKMTKALSFTPLSTGQGAAIIADQQSALIAQREAVMLQLTQNRLAGVTDPNLQAQLGNINAAMLQAGRVLPTRQIIGGGQVAVQPGITIPGLANGGIVRRPTLAMLGEGGPEAVVPLGSGTGMTVIVNVSGDVIGVDDLNSLILTTVRDNDLAGGGLR